MGTGERALDDADGDIGMTEACALGGQDETRARRNVGVGVDVDDVRLVVFVQPQIDAAVVGEPEQLERGARAASNAGGTSSSCS